MVGNNINTVSTFGLIYISSVIVALTQHFSKMDFGAIGTFSWIVVIVGVIGFVAKIVLSLSD